MLNSLGHSTSFHHIVFRSESQLGLPGLAPDCKTKKIILYLSLMMTDRAENLCKQGGSDYQARWCTSKAFPKGYTAIEMKEWTRDLRYNANVIPRLKVKIFLYLRPNRMTRSRSTLIAVSVEKDTEHNTYIVCYAGCVKWVSAKTPVFVNHGYPIVSIERPYNYTACHISNQYSLKCSINLRHHKYPKSNRKILLLFPFFCRLSVPTKTNIPS